MKMQSVPRSKVSLLVIQTSQLMLYREIIAVCSQIHTKHINSTLCGQNTQFLKVRKVSARFQRTFKRDTSPPYPVPTPTPTPRRMSSYHNLELPKDTFTFHLHMDLCVHLGTRYVPDIFCRGYPPPVSG